jgi:hypothetical protein
MSNDPNQAMDDQLKAYAESRRREAPVEFELDAATRRRLHAEVQRVYLDKPEPENSRVEWWGWMRVGLASTAAVAVLIVSVRMVPRDEPLLLTKSDHASKLVQPDDATELALSPSAARSEPLTVAPEMRPTAAATLDSRAMTQQETEARELPWDSVTLVPESAPTATPRIASERTFAAATDTTGVDRFLGAEGREFLQVQRYRRNPNSPPPPQVLQNFRWVRDGDSVRVIDADGSVYTGQVITAVPVRARRSVAVSPEGSALMRDQPVRLQPMTGQDGERFSVSGTNQTLNARVEFEGFILPSSSADGPAAAGASLSGEGGAALQIQGQAVVGSSTRLEILAVPRVE